MLMVEQIQRLYGGERNKNALILRKKNIHDIDIPSIVAFLEQQPQITSLDLWNNHLTDEGAMILAEFIKSNPPLTSINLNTNNIGEEGANALLNALVSNQILLRLNLRNNYTHPGHCFLEGSNRPRPRNFGIKQSTLLPAKGQPHQAQDDIDFFLERNQVLAQSRQDEQEFVDITEAVSRAVSKYSDFSLHLSERRYFSFEALPQSRGIALGFFSRFRHGQPGRERAAAFMEEIRCASSLEELKNKIDALIDDPATPCQNHSFSSFLWDEFSEDGKVLKMQESLVLPQH